MIDEVRGHTRDSATKNCLTQMFDNLNHEYSEIQDIQQC